MTINTLKLTPEEQSIRDGEKGAELAKAMKSVVLYGEAFGAEKLVEIVGNQHFVTSFGANTIKPYFEMMDELLAAGLKPKEPFTVDPRPMEYDAVNVDPLQKLVNKLVFGKQADYEKQLKELGIKSDRGYTCACYLDEVGNTPKKGAMLAWSESSAVVFANSVLGARTNRNSAGIDVLCAILGKAPCFGFLTDEGRKADWKIELKTGKLPNAQLLGSAIGLKVMEEVPYITGLDQYLGKDLTDEAQFYLKDMGAATASNGAVGLYHVENMTPEAKESGEKLLKKDFQTYLIDDAELQRVFDSYPVLWKDLNAVPKRIFIGCPHLSKEQLHQWIERISLALSERGLARCKVQVVLSTAPDIAVLFREDRVRVDHLKAMNVAVTSICPLMYMNNPLCSKEPIATNSNKLRTYSTARFFMDDDIIAIMCTGSVPQGGK